MFNSGSAWQEVGPKGAGAVGPSLRRDSSTVLATQAAAQLVTLGVLGVLYRQLGPEPFGLVGMVMPVLLLVRIVLSAGLDVAAIQETQLTSRQVSALFALNQGLGVAMALATAALAPLVAWFYGRAELVPLTVALAGTSLAISLGTQHQALLQRAMLLGRLARARLACQMAAGVAAIATGWAGGGVWALVVQQYVELGGLSLLAWRLHAWRPERDWHAADVRSLIHFGGHYTLSSLAFYLTTNADKILVGYVLGAPALGLYGQAFNLMMRPVHVVMTPLLGVMLPAMARARNDQETYSALLLGFYRFIALTMLPAAAGLIVVAGAAMRVLGGPAWAQAGPVLAILASALLAQGFFNALGSVLASAGLARRLAVASVLVAAVLTAGFAVGLGIGRQWGVPLEGVAAGYAATLTLVVFPPYLLTSLRAVGVSPRRWLSAIAPAAGASLAMMLVVAGCKRVVERFVAWPAAVELAVLAGLGVAVYGVLVRREIRHFLRLWRG